jgi:hypothetical protein
VVLYIAHLGEGPGYQTLLGAKKVTGQRDCALAMFVGF